jgi:hypothetical protein
MRHEMVRCVIFSVLESNANPSDQELWTSASAATNSSRNP